MAVNRSLQVSMVFSGYYDANGPDGAGYYGSATYTQTGSTPDMPGLIDSDGSIHLDRAPSFDHNQYNENIDITFNLSGSATSQGGDTLAIAWPSAIGNGVSQSAMQTWDSNNQPTSEITASFVPGDSMAVLLSDKDDDSNTYSYKPAIVIPSQNNYYISLDPRIVNKPG